jgi:hypothetical protein
MIGLMIFWCGIAAYVGVLADRRGRSGFGWTFIALIATPFMALPILFLMPERSRGSSVTVEMTVTETGEWGHHREGGGSANQRHGVS